jgi:lipoprotein-anchoring transpeptidase ErfK/SrfK
VILAAAATLLPATAFAQSSLFDLFPRRQAYSNNNSYYQPRNSYYQPYNDPVPSDADRPRRPRSDTSEREAVKNEAKKQAAPKGPVIVVVSIAKQRVDVFAEGREIAQAPVSTGVPGHPTPLGVFSVIQKQLYHESNLYSAAPMPYMQRITWSGVALHAGQLPGYPASHGCIRLPRDFAVKLYTMTKTGARVVIARDEAKPVDIASPVLFQPKPPEEPKPETPVASAGVEVVASAKSAETTQSDITSSVAAAPAPPPKPVSETPKRKGAVSVFISRKQGKLYVRQGFEPLFEMPITIADADQPIGTHVFTAMNLTDDGKTMHWSALSIPSSYPRKGEADERASRHKRDAKEAPKAAPIAGPTAAQALERIDIPADTRARIAELLTPGSSLVVSDNALSDETGIDTDFVVLTPEQAPGKGRQAQLSR